MGVDTMTRQHVRDLLLGLVIGCLLSAGAVLVLIFLLANAPLPNAPASTPHISTQPAPPRR